MKEENIVNQIYFIRHEKVMLDFDLAAMYGVETRTLKQAVKRNKSRFPSDFMFLLTIKEIRDVLSQNVIPSRSYLGGTAPMAFTEQGVAMLSGILKSKRAVQVNIAIMRTFVQIRKLMDSNRDLGKKIDDMEKKYDEKFHVIFAAIKQLIQGVEPRKKIGYKTSGDGR